MILVVSPLVALMKDQVASFNTRGITAVHVSDEKLNDANKTALDKGEYKIIFISPEALFASLQWREMLCTDLYRSNLVAFVVDEAHCVKKWGISFRREFAHLNEIRSLISEDVHLMALTATATKSTQWFIVRNLNMQNPVIVSVHPMKTNLIYSVAKKTDILHAFLPIYEQLMVKGVKMGRMIIFCRKYDEVTALYHFFRQKLGKHFTHPVGAPDLVQYRLVDMYTHCTHPSVKDSIIYLFTHDSQLRIVIGTIAFGMGINNCPDVRQIIHWGVSDDSEMYIQESGRAGRDGLLSSCFLLYGGRDLDKRMTSEAMVKYCRNEDSVCRRILLFADFDECDNSNNGCLCCDICRVNCKCGKCDDTLSLNLSM